MTWRLTFRPSAERQFDDLDPPVRDRIRRGLLRLAADPKTAPNVKPIKDGGYRLRVGDWRVIYDLDGDRLVILVVKLGHRREVYRD